MINIRNCFAEKDNDKSSFGHMAFFLLDKIYWLLKEEKSKVKINDPIEEGLKGNLIRLENPLKYRIGQSVKYEVKTKDSCTGLTFSNEVIAYISSIMAVRRDNKNSVRRTYKYGITTSILGEDDGKDQFTWIDEDDIKLF